MKKFLLGATALAVMFVGPAMAADMPVKARPPLVAPAFSWTGCHVGINGGWLRGRDRVDLAPSGSYLNPPGTLSPPNIAGTGDFPASIAALSHSYGNQDSGGLVGGQVGCNYQAGVFVFGGEADLQWSSLKNGFTAAYGAFPNPGNPAFTNAAHTETVSNNVEWFSTFRGRAGFAWDRVFIYGTGGVAVAGIQSNTNVSFGVFPLLSVYNGAVHTGSASLTKTGSVAGGGIEWAFSPNWLMKAEYLHIGLHTQAYTSPLVAAVSPTAVGAGYAWTTRVRTNLDVARVGVNYRFN
jgi:outer membrane immunogenic protein